MISSCDSYPDPVFGLLFPFSLVLKEEMWYDIIKYSIIK